MTDTFSLSLDQAKELECAFRRNEWTAADVHRLCYGSVLAKVLDFVNQQYHMGSILLVEEVFTADRAQALGFASRQRRVQWLLPKHVITLGDLSKMRKAELMRLPGMGPTAISFIKTVLHQHNLQLAD